MSSVPIPPPGGPASGSSASAPPGRGRGFVALLLWATVGRLVGQGLQAAFSAATGQTIPPIALAPAVTIAAMAATRPSRWPAILAMAVAIVLGNMVSTSTGLGRLGWEGRLVILSIVVLFPLASGLLLRLAVRDLTFRTPRDFGTGVVVLGLASAASSLPQYWVLRDLGLLDRFGLTNVLHPAQMIVQGTLGAFLIVPPVTRVMREGWQAFRLVRDARVGTALAVLCATVLAAGVFLLAPPTSILGPLLPLVTLPPTLWAARRAGLMGAFYAIVPSSAVAMVATAFGHGPFFAQGEWLMSMLGLQAYMAVVVGVSYTIGTDTDRLRRHPGFGDTTEMELP